MLSIGCQDNRELRTMREFLEEFTEQSALVWASEAAMLSALTDFAPLKLSRGIGTLGCLIAAMVIEQGITLLTFNTRHFRHVPNLNFAAPYTRRPITRPRSCQSIEAKRETADGGSVLGMRRQ